MRRLFASIALSAAMAATLVPAAAASAQQGGTLAPQQALQNTPTSTAAPVAMVHQDVAGIRVAPDAAPLEVNSAAATGLNQGQGVALMTVGGAGLLAGLLIGGDAGAAVAIGGLAVGLVGLYQYVK